MRTLTGVGPGVWLRRGGVTPLSIFGDRLKLWLDIHQRRTIGTGVSAVSDRSRSANNASQPTGSLQAALVAAQAGGRDVARFDGVDDYLIVANHASLQPRTGNFTVFVVMKRRTSPIGDYPQVIGSRPWVSAPDKGWCLCVGGTSLTGQLGVHYADGATGFDVGGCASTSVVSTSAFEVWHVEVDKTAGQVRFYKNGTLDVTRTPVFPSGDVNQTNNVYVGRDIDGGNNRRMNADLAEVGYISGVPSTAERAALVRALRVRNGV